MVVEGERAETLLALEALDALLVEGSSVPGHDRFRGKHGNLAGRTSRGGRRGGPRHPAYFIQAHIKTRDLL